MRYAAPKRISGAQAADDQRGRGREPRLAAMPSCSRPTKLMAIENIVTVSTSEMQHVRRGARSCRR